MRWTRLFDDLETQWAAQERLELDAEVADRTRRERATIALDERLVGQAEEAVTMHLVAGPPVTGRVDDVGDGWVLLAPAERLRVLLPLVAVVGVVGLAARPTDAARARRFGLGYALRGLSRDRVPVTILDRSGGRIEGTIDGVGADACDVSEHALDEARRAGAVRARRVVPFGAIVSVTARD